MARRRAAKPAPPEPSMIPLLRGPTSCTRRRLSRKGSEIARHMVPFWSVDREATHNDLERLVEVWIGGNDGPE